MNLPPVLIHWVHVVAYGFAIIVVALLALVLWGSLFRRGR